MFVNNLSTMFVLRMHLLFVSLLLKQNVENNMLMLKNITTSLFQQDFKFSTDWNIRRRPRERYKNSPQLNFRKHLRLNKFTKHTYKRMFA